MILKGALQLLNDIRPQIYIEVGPSHAKQVSKLLAAANYEFFAIDSPDQTLETCPFNTLAIPIEKNRS